METIQNNTDAVLYVKNLVFNSLHTTIWQFLIGVCIIKILVLNKTYAWKVKLKRGCNVSVIYTQVIIKSIYFLI